MLSVQLCHCVATASRTTHQGIAPCLLVLLLGSRFSGPVVNVSTALPGDILAKTVVLQADASSVKGKHHTSVCEGQDQTLIRMNKSLAQGSALNPDAPSFTSTWSNFCASSVSVLLWTVSKMHQPHTTLLKYACCSIVGARGHTCLSV